MKLGYLILGFIALLLSQNVVSADTCPIIPAQGEFSEAQDRMVEFRVLEACSDWIDTSKEYSVWGGWKPCLCGAGQGAWRTAKATAYSIMHPIESITALYAFFKDLPSNMKVITQTLAAEFKKHEELSFEEKKAINCEVITSIAFGTWGIASVSKATKIAISKVKSRAIARLTPLMLELQDKGTVRLSNNVISAHELAKITRVTGREASPGHVDKSGKLAIGLGSKEFSSSTYNLHTHPDSKLTSNIPAGTREIPFKTAGDEFRLSQEDLRALTRTGDQYGYVVLQDGNVIRYDVHGVTEVLENPEQIFFRISRNGHIAVGRSQRPLGDISRF